jgi:hypothetical protein
VRQRSLWHGAFAWIILAGLLVVSLGSSLACNGSRITSTVTCGGLRQIKLGMDRATVARLLGPPVASSGRFVPVGKNPADELWTYSTENNDPFYLFSHSDKMDLDFRDGRLIQVEAVRKLDQFPPEPLLFLLYYESSPDGTRKEVRQEGRLFTQAFCPAASGKAE